MGEWRHALPPEALDETGHIIDQSKTGTIKFGRRGSVRCGCGWIAAYNLWLWRGEKKDPQRLARQLNHLSPMSGTVGVNLIFLTLYLAAHGFHPRVKLITPGTKKGFGPAGIIMYRAGRHRHYAAYEHLHDGQYCFYNAVYGRREHIATFRQFFSAQSKRRLALLIKVRK